MIFPSFFFFWSIHIKYKVQYTWNITLLKWDPQCTPFYMLAFNVVCNFRFLAKMEVQENHELGLYILWWTTRLYWTTIFFYIPNRQNLSSKKGGEDVPNIIQALKFLSPQNVCVWRIPIETGLERSNSRREGKLFSVFLETWTSALGPSRKVLILLWILHFGRTSSNLLSFSFAYIYFNSFLPRNVDALLGTVNNLIIYFGITIINQPQSLCRYGEISSHHLYNSATTSGFED